MDGGRDVEAGYPPPATAGGNPRGGREGVESGYSTQSREKDKKEDYVIDSDNQVWTPQEILSTATA